MKKAIALILCLLLLTGCTSPAAVDTATEPTQAAAMNNTVETVEPTAATEETREPAEPIIQETEAPTEAEPIETLPQYLYVAEKCQDLLNMDYPVFLLAGIAIMENEYMEKYAPAEDATSFDVTRYENGLRGIPYLNTYSMDLNVSKNSEILFTYYAPAPDGNHETTVVLDLDDTGWEKTPTVEEAYSQLLDLAVGADGAYATACEWLFSALLQDDPAAFSQALSQRPDDEITHIAGFISWDFFYASSLDELEQIANSLTEETVKTALLTAIAERRA